MIIQTNYNFKSIKMSITKHCKCVHKDQDEIYGKNNRLHNLSEDGKKAKCTVCNNIVLIGNASKK